MSKRINIMLPERTVAVLDRVAGKGRRSQFISRAVLHYVESQGRQSLKERLKAGYLADTEESLKIAAEWFPIEEEAWQNLAPPAKGKSQQYEAWRGLPGVL
jgi:CopG family transcriptional regulator/antitoxin EndoAI